jgi:hypothetical protein
MYRIVHTADNVQDCAPQTMDSIVHTTDNGQYCVPQTMDNIVCTADKAAILCVLQTMDSTAYHRQ